jgi:hypothetical protein
MHELALQHTFTLAYATRLHTRSLPTLAEGSRDFAATVADLVSVCVFSVRARALASAERCWRSRVRRSSVRPNKPSARDGLWAR